MNEMRLPGLGWLNNETASVPEGNGDTPRDPAQAFDAVMSRFSGEKTQPPANAKTSAPAKADDNARPAQAKAPAAANGRSQASTPPAARTKADAGDEESADPAAASDATADPSALVAAVAESAQLAKHSASVAPAADAVVAPEANNKTHNDVATSPSALDVLAGQTNAATARAPEKLTLETRVPTEHDDDVAAVDIGATPNRRTPAAAAKDTLRAEASASFVRTLEPNRIDLAQRVASVATAAVELKTNAASPLTTDMTAQTIATAVAAGGIGNTTPATYSIAHTSVSSPVGTPGFAGELAQKVVLFAGQKVQRAEIAVTPPDLGPIAVSIEVRGQEATLAFAASSHTARTAIEDALPRLRDMLSAQGLQLAGTYVGSEPRRESYRPAQNTKNPGNHSGAREGVATVSASSGTQIRRRVNLIDIEV